MYFLVVGHLPRNMYHVPGTEGGGYTAVDDLCLVDEKDKTGHHYHWAMDDPATCS